MGGQIYGNGLSTSGCPSSSCGGIFVGPSSGKNIIDGVQITNNAGYGVTLDSAGGTTITNNFIGNTIVSQQLYGIYYDSSNNIFITPSPYPSWSFNYSTKQWEAPIPKPSDFGEITYEWNEADASWITVDSIYNDSINFLVQELNITDATSNTSNLTTVTSNTIETPVSVTDLNLSFITENHPGINENTEITHENGMIIMTNLTPPTQ